MCRDHGQEERDFIVRLIFLIFDSQFSCVLPRGPGTNQVLPLRLGYPCCERAMRFSQIGILRSFEQGPFLDQPVNGCASFLVAV